MGLQIHLFLGALLLVTTGPAWAHARLVKAMPADGASLSRAPESVVLVFNEVPEIEFSSIKIAGPQSELVLEQTPRKGPNPNSLAVPLPKSKLRDGRYLVNYRVLSVDGHLVEGRTSFSIAPVTP
jgi:methionine-rich copper-binding protein CopC